MSECGVVKKKFCVFSTVTEKKNEKKKINYICTPGFPAKLLARNPLQKTRNW